MGPHRLRCCAGSLIQSISRVLASSSSAYLTVKFYPQTQTQILRESYFLSYRPPTFSTKMNPFSQQGLISIISEEIIRRILKFLFVEETYVIIRIRIFCVCFHVVTGMQNNKCILPWWSSNYIYYTLLDKQTETLK